MRMPHPLRDSLLECNGCKLNMAFSKISPPQREDLGEREGSYELGGYFLTKSVHPSDHEGMRFS